MIDFFKVKFFLYHNIFIWMLFLQCHMTVADMILNHRNMHGILSAAFLQHTMY